MGRLAQTLGVESTMTTPFQRRMLYIPVLQVDANLINARQKLPEVNQLEKWYESEVLLINMSSTARDEALADGNPARTRKANEQIFTMTPAARTNDSNFIKVERALFPNGAVTENERNDVRVVCEAAKYAAILVTADGASKTQPGGILGNRNRLKGFVEIMSPAEAVGYVRVKIFERDEFNRQVALIQSVDVPSYTGKD